MSTAWLGPKVVVALIAFSAVWTGQALAAVPVDQGFSAPCGGGTVSFPGARVLWPPDHKYHPYAVTYSGGSPGDVVTVGAFSTDGVGVASGPQTATVAPDATGASAAIGLFADRSPDGVARTYVISFSVSGSNNCGGLSLATMPHDGRPSA